MSRIDARHGAFGIVPDHLDGALVSHDFPCFNVDEHIILRRISNGMRELSNSSIIADGQAKDRLTASD